MELNPEQEIERVKAEYAPQDSVHDAGAPTQGPRSKPRVGYIWYDPETNTSYVCNARIHGEYKWTKIS
jgi:hypothetical protein